MMEREEPVRISFREGWGGRVVLRVQTWVKKRPGDEWSLMWRDATMDDVAEIVIPQDGITHQIVENVTKGGN